MSNHAIRSSGTCWMHFLTAIGKAAGIVHIIAARGRPERRSILNSSHMTISALLPTLSWLTSIASRFTRTTAEAEDCAIIALERIAPRLDEFPTEGHAKAFLVKTARNAAIDAGKQAAATERIAKRWLEGQDYSDEQVEMALRMRMVLEYGVPRLQPRQQEMARMFLAGRSFDEVAQAMGMSRKSVVNQHGLIIKDLRRWVKRGKLQ